MHAPRWMVFLWFSLILGAWAVRELPWNLDDYDQAKQAYTSYEMIGQGHWWWQHTPRQDQATKPPLAGWLSAGLREVTGSWDLAWRLPSFLAAVAILWLLWKGGRRVAGDEGGFVATGAFAWNLLSLRLATLVRTDMLLAALIFVSGWLIWRRLERNEKWTWADLCGLTLLLGAAAMTKGPIYHAFLLPGAIAWAVLAREHPLRWKLPLMYLIVSMVSVLPFLLWTWLRIRHDPSFYDQVVVKEFLGRFTTGEKAVHNNQTWYFYLPHLVAKCAPWSLAMLAALCSNGVRQYIRRNPATLWLVCWAIGGVIVMSLVPSKRVDRIFPVVPVFALALAAIIPAIPRNRIAPGKLVAGCCLLGMSVFLGYTIYSVVDAYRHRLDSLVDFGARVRAEAAVNHWTFAVAEGRDEGMLMYLGESKFLEASDIAVMLKTQKLSAAVVDDKALQILKKSGVSFQEVLSTTHPMDRKYHYYLVSSTAQPAKSF